MKDETTLKSLIRPFEEGKSLLEFLSGRFRYHDAGAWRSLVLEKAVTVNGRGAAPELILRKGDSVEYTVTLDEPEVDGNIVMVLEEETFCVAHKPGNLPTHSDGNFITHTFIYLLRERLGAIGSAVPVNPVNRLDRETSGLIVVSKNREAHRALTRQFEAGTVDKEYIAVARGVVEKDEYTVTGAIARDEKSAVSIRKTVVPDDHPGARASTTVFRVMERLDGATVLLCVPKTGRTNQIRVHLEHAGHPLAGDKLYGRSDREFLEFVERARQRDPAPLAWLETGRHLLHAAGIAFDHPLTGERVICSSPLPADMEEFIARRRIIPAPPSS